MYSITEYSKLKAKEIGVEIKSSIRKGKKLDVFKNGKLIASIGQLGAGDYPTFVKEKGQVYADERRRLYHLRHKKNTLAEQLALLLLW